MGTWNVELGGQKTDMALEQKFQHITGTIGLGPINAGLRDARLRGTAIYFSYVDPQGMRRDFAGRVNGNRMEGNFRDEKGAEGKWSAAKK
jgi:hypothetical protein